MLPSPCQSGNSLRGFVSRARLPDVHEWRTASPTGLKLPMMRLDEDPGFDASTRGDKHSRM